MSTTTPRALNLRISSLDPNAPKAKKDCKTCNRRRIRCDRSLPTCAKCRIRNLECPGYDLKLKWDQGVASRGRLAGKSLPIHEHKEEHASWFDGENTGTIIEQPKRPLVAPQIKYEIVNMKEMAFDCTNVKTRTANFSSLDQVVPPTRSHPNFRIELPKTIDMHPELQSQNMKELVHHYDQNLAATLVWVDNSDNPWRNFVLPLAYEEPSLLFSVLALAAEHLSKRAREDSLQRISRQTDASKFRDKSLKLLVSHLKREIDERQNDTQQLLDGHHKLAKATSVKTILATMLMLCQVEMVHSESSTWKVHLQASHTMIQRWLLTPSRLDIGDADNKFLIKETFTINVFAATTSFTNEEEESTFVDADDNTLFSGFMTAIHEITKLERRIAAGEMKFSDDLSDLERRLEDARASTQQLASDYDKLRPEETRLNFDRVIDIYHHAGIIYAYQALATPQVARDFIQRRFGLLLEALHLLPASGLFAQDLAWPLFIASTNCRKHERERQWLQKKMEDSADATGFASCHQAWEFLRKWWDRDEDAPRYANWIGYARARAGRGFTFLVI